MARNLVSKRKKPMGTAIASTRDKKLTARAAEEVLVNDLLKMSRKFLAKVPAEEREAKLRKLNAYLSSLEGTVARRA